jgi:hypothetical protein
MAADVVKHALTLINADELKVVAEKLGVDPVKLRDVSRTFRRCGLEFDFVSDSLN